MNLLMDRCVRASLTVFITMGPWLCPDTGRLHVDDNKNNERFPVDVLANDVHDYI